MNSAGQAGGAMCTILFGYLVDAYGYNIPLLPIAAMVMTAAFLFFLIDPTRAIVAPQFRGPVGDVVNLSGTS